MGAIKCKKILPATSTTPQPPGSSIFRWDKFSEKRNKAPGAVAAEDHTKCHSYQPITTNCGSAKLDNRRLVKNVGWYDESQFLLQLLDGRV